MKKIIVLIALLALVVFISGCAQQPAQNCGNSVCDSSETIETCPADCQQPPMPADNTAGGSEAPPSLPF